jgi:predicted Ser/Thr protein kinase
MNTDTHQTPQLPQTDVKWRFFAQYWGQNLLGSTHFNNQKAVMFNYDLFGALNTSNGLISATEAFKTYFLWLKPLSKITDEDAIVVAKIFGMKEDFEFIGKMLCTTMFDNSDSESETVIFNSNAKAVDYLRSKGYALPFMEYSVEDLVSFGWVRLV